MIIKEKYSSSLQDKVLWHGKTKEEHQKRFCRNRAHSNCSFASLNWFRKVHVRHAFLINGDKILS